MDGPGKGLRVGLDCPYRLGALVANAFFWLRLSPIDEI